MRAEEIIVEIYRQRSELAEQGRRPERVLLSPSHYKVIQEYRRQLGELTHRENDYLDDYRVFDLEICIGNSGSPRVVWQDAANGEP